MKIGFLVIASEVLDGKISDLNTKILAEFLRTKHLEVSEAMVARDEKRSIETALKALLARNDLVITSGGLGPTKDDITKETIADFLGRKVKFSPEAQKISEENYARLNRPFPGPEHGYCFLPEGFFPLSNHTGFAPCFYSEFEHKILLSGPGVPREFKSLLNDHLPRIIQARLTSAVLGHVVIRTKHVPEEKIFGEVDPKLWERLSAFGEVSSLPILMGVDIGIKLRAKDHNEMSSKTAAILEIVKTSPIYKNVWHIGPESIEERIITLANQKKVRFGFAESATGGLCSHRITSVSGASQCFMGSVICYDERIKENSLGVSPETLQIHTAVSHQCAEEMARGLRERFSVDIAISVTGFAGPGGGNERFPVGSVLIGRFDGKEAKTEAFTLKGDREILKQRFSQAALYALLEELENFA